MHKEAVDKIPNALPHKNNIEIEIYGMEGIPPADIKEHEAQKKGGSKQKPDSDSSDDEDTAKRPRLSNDMLPGQMLNQPNLGGPMGGMLMHGQMPVNPGVEIQVLLAFKYFC